MRFSRLRLNGFKSFVDPTDLVIADGLTGVVGPNGCGKSNLLEGLRWVMGETRAKAMRGGGMEDVIFAGTSSRNPRNFAEVSLTIDNSERLAPAGFNELDQLDVVRRITRDAGSAYKTNGRDVRARDVQMLFADASTGAHSPALVRQGMISELINAKPKARRRILEEAAGISGLYARRHEAELKLKGTETNLARVEDVLEQLASQLSTLARQAKQAERYRTIGTDLRRAEGMLLFRRWKEADTTRQTTAEEFTERTRLAGAAETAARQAATARQTAEDVLPPLREEEAIAAAILQRLLVQRDALDDQETQAQDLIRTLQNRIMQLGADMEREAGLNKDAGETIERLEWEQEQIQKAHEGADDALSAAQEQARTAAEVLAEQEEQLGTMTEDVARLSARHQSANRLLTDTQKALTQGEAEATRANDAMGAAKASLVDAQAAFEDAEIAQAAAVEATEFAETALLDAEEARTQMQGQETTARAMRSEAEGEANAIRAEVSALARLVERDASDDGQVIDQVRVDTGYEKALGAALAEDLRAPEIAADQMSGWVDLPEYDAHQGLPSGVRALNEFVTVPHVLARRIGQVGLVDAVDGADIQAALLPGQSVVSIEGDLWRWDGFRAGAEDAPSAAALRLQQLNKLVSMKADLEIAEGRAEEAIDAHTDITAQLADLTHADQSARDARRLADRDMSDAGRALSRAEAEQSIANGKVESLTLAVARHEEEAMAARMRLREAETGVADLGDLDAARASVEDIKMTVEAARITMMTKRSIQDELRRDGDRRTKRSQEITKEISGWRHRLDTATTRIDELADRKAENEDSLEDAIVAPDEITAKREELGDAIETAEERRGAASEALAGAENTLREAVAEERDCERTAGEAREVRARSEARAEAARDVVIQAAERIAEDQETTPQALLETLDIDPDAMPTSEVIESDVNRLKRQREALGAVNLRAEEDAYEVQQEHDNLRIEKIDLEQAVHKLRAGIASLNKEGRERLLTAFEQVNSNFTLLFQHLFGGGEAELLLVESDDPLDAGLEIMCQPPGKKLSTLSLLSGGEQTLTALALIFAVFLANPAPICVLDEVDAPLDDANVTRFCDLLDEMVRRTNTRFLIITHHAVTMARMDRLFGVTMAEQGVSQLVSVDLRKAEELVA